MQQNKLFSVKDMIRFLSPITGVTRPTTAGHRCLPRPRVYPPNRNTNTSRIKLAFHDDDTDMDTDTDIDLLGVVECDNNTDTDFLARILADTSDTRN